jgi:hypothetical protein
VTELLVVVSPILSGVSDGIQSMTCRKNGGANALRLAFETAVKEFDG